MYAMELEGLHCRKGSNAPLASRTAAASVRIVAAWAASTTQATLRPLPEPNRRLQIKPDPMAYQWGTVLD